MLDLKHELGDIDIYLFDQILRGRITPRMRVVDAGCGFGRNLVYLLRAGCDVYAVDVNPEAVGHVRQMAAELGRELAVGHFVAGPLEQMPFPSAFADALICSAVLHFARSMEHFRAMLAEVWRVLRPGGLLFCRLGTRIGLDFPRSHGDLYRMPNDANWFLADEAMLMQLSAEMNAELVDPLKTTIVQGARCMTTWVLRKPLQE